MREEKFENLKGKTMTSVYTIDEDRLRFEADDGSAYELYHTQDCCERVVIDDICGELADLIGTPILLAEESTGETPEDVKNEEGYVEPESQTWTFYKLRTIKGSVDVRWHGTSNGCYSERVEFSKVE